MQAQTYSAAILHSLSSLNSNISSHNSHSNSSRLLRERQELHLRVAGLASAAM